MEGQKERSGITDHLLCNNQWNRALIQYSEQHHEGDIITSFLLGRKLRDSMVSLLEITQLRESWDKGFSSHFTGSFWDSVPKWRYGDLNPGRLALQPAYLLAMLCAWSRLSVLSSILVNVIIELIGNQRQSSHPLYLSLEWNLQS